MQHGWDIEFTDEFGRWWDTLPMVDQAVLEADRLYDEHLETLRKEGLIG